MFKYEPSWAHTSRTFNARMDERMKEARKDQTAIQFMQAMDIAEGSVNFDPRQMDIFDAPGG
jgi:hypothetical protein